MPRTIDPALEAALQLPVLNLATCVKLTRTDGTVLGLTSTNQSLTFAGTVYEPLDSMTASEMRQTTASGIDNLEVVGVLQSSRITDADLLVGRYDGAAIELFVVNVNDNPLVHRVLLLTGTFGEVTFSEGTYQAELRSLSQRLQQRIGSLTSQTCRVRQLFDAQCFVGGVNYQATHVPADFRAVGTVVTVNNQADVIFSGGVYASGVYDQGQITFLTGANANLPLECKNSFTSGGSNMRLQFELAWPFTVAVGDTATLEQGCDRTFLTCAAKFQNLGNHRAEPFLPGNSRLVRWGRR